MVVCSIAAAGQNGHLCLDLVAPLVGYGVAPGQQYNRLAARVPCCDGDECVWAACPSGMVPSSSLLGLGLCDLMLWLLLLLVCGSIGTLFLLHGLMAISKLCS